MSEWTAGYITEIDYTHGYYPELSPLRAQTTLEWAGLFAPKIDAACELAFGQGISLNINAAAGVAHWDGNDFNPAQASFAAEMASYAGNSGQLTDESFAEFCNRSDLPDYDFIGLHGIFSWVTAENQRHIESFIKQKLKKGGVLYISYNTFPGWSAMLPVQHLLSQHAQVLGAPGSGVLSRLDAALQFADQVLATQPMSARQNPSMAERYKRMRALNRHYLAHEYFNRNWEPMFFAEMAQRLQDCKLSYGCSAAATDFVDALNVTTDQANLLRTITDPVYRETVRDFITNQQFRRDYWVKGARRMTQQEQLQTLRAQRYMLTASHKTFQLKISCGMGEATLQEKVYLPLLEALSNYQAHSVGALETRLKEHGVGIQNLMQSLMVMVSKGTIQPVQSESAIAAALPRTQKLNRWLIERARGHAEIATLASAMTGSGLVVTRIEQLFLLGTVSGHKSAEALASFVWGILQPQGQRMLKEGKPIENAEENLAELKRQADSFVADLLPVSQAHRLLN